MQEEEVIEGSEVTEGSCQRLFLSIKCQDTVIKTQVLRQTAWFT